MIRRGRTLADRPMKGAALAVDEKRLVRAVAERTWLSTEESADITRAVVQGLAGQLSEGEARRLAGDLPSRSRTSCRWSGDGGRALIRSTSPLSSAS
jgi:uncharacterized protein (DUF2267 family)